MNMKIHENSIYKTPIKLIETPIYKNQKNQVKYLITH